LFAGRFLLSVSVHAAGLGSNQWAHFKQARRPCLG
jgi:hypothetical protein